MRVACFMAAALASIGLVSGLAPMAFADCGGDHGLNQGGPPSINNAATHHHGLPNNNPSRGGAAASPNGTGKNGGGGIHGIGNVPGQLGINPNDDGVPGFANQLDTVHGGLGGGHQPGRHRH